MNTFERMWRKLIHDRNDREEFALAMLKRMVPFQVRAIRKKRGWSQAELAQQAKLTQGVVSRAEDPDYGNLTLNTIGRVAGGFDLAFIGRFVPFSELVEFSQTLSEKEFQEIQTGELEDAAHRRGEDLANRTNEAGASSVVNNNHLAGEKKFPVGTRSLLGNAPVATAKMEARIA